MYIRTPGICIYLEREGYSFFFAPLPFLSFFFFSCIQIQTKRKKKKRNGKRVQSKEGNREWASARGMNRRKRECGYRTEKEIEWKVSKLLIYLRLIRSHVVKNALQLSLLVRLFIKLCRLNTFILAGFLFFVCVYVYIYSLSLSLSLSCVCLPICIFDLIIIISFFLFVVFLVFRRRAIFTTSARWDWKSPASCPSTARQRWRTVARYWHRSPFPLRNSTRSPFSAHLMDTWKRYSVWHWCSGKQKFVSIARSGVQCKCNKLRTAHTHTQWGDVIRLRVSFLCG